jgi:peptidylprolyl isomerase
LPSKYKKMRKKRGFFSGKVKALIAGVLIIVVLVVAFQIVGKNGSPASGDVKAPTVSSTHIDAVTAAATCKFSSYWSDNVGLSGYIFSTNNTGTWVNDTMKSLNGMAAWANTTKTLNSNVGGVIGYRWYCVDSNNKWSSTGIKTLTTTSGTTTVILLSTSMGDIIIELYDDMPITSGNFKNLTEHGIYDGTIFHRVVANFVIQGGDASTKGITVPAIPDELPNKHSNVRGSVAMAKTSQPNSATSQFYINLKDNTNLDSNYSVFGRVVAGMDVVDAIGKVAVDSNDKPLQDVTLIRAQIIT